MTLVKQERAALAARSDLVGEPLRTALTALYDSWLADLVRGAASSGVALVAVGALGRRDPSLGSDLDLVLVHDGGRDAAELAKVAEAVWYPVWDAGVELDHSVRTVAQAVDVARGDLKAALGLLDARHVAGDPALSEALVAETRRVWRAGASTRLPELRAAVLARAQECGELAFLLEPDLKQARGGLRDVHALQALAVAQVADPPGPAVRAAHEVLLDVRGELHRVTGAAGRRAVDRLLMQEQDAVAAALSYEDADALLLAVATAGRTIAYASDTTWRRALPPTRRRSLLPRRPGPSRRPLAQDVVEQDGEVLLARDADPQADPVLVLRVAEAAARAGLPLAPITLERLAAGPPLPEPWPPAAREALVGLLATGPPAVPVLEALDQADLLVRLVPEWSHVRNRPQRNSYHRYTVDRHLLETAAGAAGLTRRVARPDLLLVAGLLHDIGKGRPGDHSVLGAELVAQIAPRLGFDEADTDVLVLLVRQHLLLPDVATRRDLADPATAQGVAALVGTVDVLELLHALTEADSLATGPAAWSDWKAQLLGVLVRRTAALLEGRPEPVPAPLDAAQQALVDAGDLALLAEGDRVTVVAPDRTGLLSLTAGVLALHRLDVRAVEGWTTGPTGVVVVRAAPRFGSAPDWAVVRSDLRAALDGTLDVSERLRAREASYPVAPLAQPPQVRVLDDVSASATVVEVRAPDAIGVLHRITAVLARRGTTLRSVHASTLGADVVDAFYVDPLEPAAAGALVEELLGALR